jgi:hypothetical protein
VTEIPEGLTTLMEKIITAVDSMILEALDEADFETSVPVVAICMLTCLEKHSLTEVTLLIKCTSF